MKGAPTVNTSTKTKAMHPLFNELPILGVGLGLRRAMVKETFSAGNALQWLEVTPENFIDRGGSTTALLEEAKGFRPLISHGVNLSIASKEESEEYLQSLQTFLEEIHAPWFSDHLCFSRVDGVYVNELLPIQRNKASLTLLVDRIQRLQDRMQRRFLIEPISYYMELPGHDYSETDFLCELTEQADCGLLLDINNVYVNSQNLGGDPRVFTEQLPLHRVVQCHMAGHDETANGLLDTHSQAVCPDVWELYHWTMERITPCGVMIERDGNYPDDFQVIGNELEQLRVGWNATQTLQLPGTEKKQVSYA